jgi:uncharacterized protein
VTATPLTAASTAVPRPVEDRDSAPWWAAVREHRLTVQRCAGCSWLRFPPRALCRRCRSRDSAWVDVSGRGNLVSWVVTHHAFLPTFEVPYTVGLVRLAEQDDLLMYGDVQGVEPGTLAAGRPVQASFRDVDADLTLVHWRPG